MRPQLQANRHDEAAGVYGDCHRTCLAMILDMDRDDVPHFMHGVPNAAGPDHPESVRCQREQAEWLAGMGLAVAELPFAGSIDLQQVLDQTARTCSGVAAILGCTSVAGFGHSVVIMDGEVWNPAGRGRDGITGPMAMAEPGWEAGAWWVTFLVRATAPLRAPADPAKPDGGQETR